MVTTDKTKEIIMKTNKELYTELKALVDKANEALKNAEDFADEHGLEFHFSPAYGMGGHYVGNSENIRNKWNEKSYENDTEAGWHPSSMSC